MPTLKTEFWSKLVKTGQTWSRKHVGHSVSSDQDFVLSVLAQDLRSSETNSNGAGGLEVHGQVLKETETHY